MLITFTALSLTISSPRLVWLRGELLVVPWLVDGLWVMVWWVWFRLKRPGWLPKAVVVQNFSLSMVGNLLGGEFIFGLVSHPIAAAFHLLSLLARLGFVVLLISVVVLGGRLQGREGWVALPAVALLGVSKFATELGSFAHSTQLVSFWSRASVRGRRRPFLSDRRAVLPGHRGARSISLPV